MINKEKIWHGLVISLAIFSKCIGGIVSIFLILGFLYFGYIYISPYVNRTIDNIHQGAITSTLPSDPQGRIASCADLYENGVGSTINIPTAGDYHKWVTSSIGQETGANFADANSDTDTIVIGEYGAGIYYSGISASFEGEQNAEIRCGVFVDGARQDSLSFRRFMFGPAKSGSASAVGLLSLVNGNVLDVRCTSDTNGDDIVIYHMDLAIARIEI